MKNYEHWLTLGKVIAVIHRPTKGDVFIGPFCTSYCLILP